jgi:hypothetical protein
LRMNVYSMRRNCNGNQSKSPHWLE